MAAFKPAAQHSPRPETTCLGDSDITSARNPTGIFSHSIFQDAANTCTSTAPYAYVRAGKQCNRLSVETVTDSRWQDNVSDQSEFSDDSPKFDVRLCADTSVWLALREQLLAQVQNHHLPHHRPEHQLSNTASPHHHNIDPAIAGTGIMNPGAGDSGGDDGASDGRKGGKRELSTSKRAAQNRAAQVCGLFIIVVLLYGPLFGSGMQEVSCAKVSFG